MSSGSFVQFFFFLVQLASARNKIALFCCAELTPEHQKILIDIRRKKTELLLEIQVSQLFSFPFATLL